MQWPTTVLVIPLLPTLLGLIKKRAPPYPHAIATFDIYVQLLLPVYFLQALASSEVQLGIAEEGYCNDLVNCG
jgi:hypothetical protein